MSSELGWRADLSYGSAEAVAVRDDLRGSGLPGLAELTVDPHTENFEKLGTAAYAGPTARGLPHTHTHRDTHTHVYESALIQGVWLTLSR